MRFPIIQPGQGCNVDRYFYSKQVINFQWRRRMPENGLTISSVNGDTALLQIDPPPRKSSAFQVSSNIIFFCPQLDCYCFVNTQEMVFYVLTNQEPNK